MALYQSAKKLASMGFHVFPIKENSKKPPAVRDFTASAVNSSKDCARFWFDKILGFEHPYNIGIATTHFKDGGLLVVDVDNKNGKNGSQTILKLELEGFDFPKTLTQKTPSGGLHYIYKVKKAAKQGADIFGKGSAVDTRSRGGYIVGAGSEIDGKFYTFEDESVPVANAPEWLIKKCNEGVTSERKAQNEARKNKNSKISQKGAMARGEDYLLNNAETAVEGAGGDHTTFVVASKLKDMGVNEDNCLELMLENWNEQCQPPWNPDELLVKIQNAYSYGQNKQGVDTPEADFGPATKVKDKKELDDKKFLGPVEELNKEYAFMVMGGKSTILRQTKKGEISYMSVQAFHDLLKARTIQAGSGKKKQLSELWLASQKRATYDKAELIPGKKAPPGVFNLWRGFSCKPLGKDETPTDDMVEGVKLLKEHMLKNICQDDEPLFQWLFGYFAHLIQKPWKKPLTALVFKGEKGVGKNVCVDSIGRLLNGHYLLTSNRRYITSNFNKHLANLVLFVLDEAFWSGDKQAEGILKDLITGHTHLIEHKGREMFSAKNVIRLVIIGNDDWIIPAGKSERRFAVFNVGEKRRRDKKFFKKMENLLCEKEGNRLLLKEFMDFDLEPIDVDEAPETQGLLEQKIESLHPIHSWWLSSLKEGEILNFQFGEDKWPGQIDRQALREAFLSYSKARGVRSWLADASVFGRLFSKCCPGAKSQRLGGRVNRSRNYTLPGLAQCRDEFGVFMGHNLDWEDEPNNVIDAANLFS